MSTVKASVRQEGRYTERRVDSVTERQNDSMADSRAAKEPALVFLREWYFPTNLILLSRLSVQCSQQTPIFKMLFNVVILSVDK